MSSDCRSCNSLDLELLGSLPDTHQFAGTRLASPLSGGSLWRCLQCHLVFRDPILSQAGYDALYQQGAADELATEHDRVGFQFVRRFLPTGLATPTALDVGCYTGQLLASFPQDYRRYGIEPGLSAAMIAKNRGINVIAPTVADLGSSAASDFDVITACDVVEHVADPLQFLKQLRPYLRPNGRLMLTTGNSDAWLWRLMKGRFWYSFFGEHISFIGERWIQKASVNAGYRIVACVRFNYLYRWYDPRRLTVAGRTLLFALAPSLYCRFQRLFGQGGNLDLAYPGAGATADHVLVVLEPS